MNAGGDIGAGPIGFTVTVIAYAQALRGMGGWS